MEASYLELLKLAAPEAILAVVAFVVLGVDLIYGRDLDPGARSLIEVMIACAGCLLAGAWILALRPEGGFSAGMLIINPIRSLAQTGILILGALTLVASLDSNLGEHRGEGLCLLLLATAGMLFLVSSADVLMIFISLELIALCLYVLTGFDACSPRSGEAALKYFLFGGMSAAFMLFGLSLIYGLTGTTSLAGIASALASRRLDSLMLLAMILASAGFAFKVAAAPFHLWAPDVYQVAPAPIAAFIASGSKVAGFFLLLVFMVSGLRGAEGNAAWHNYAPGWAPMLAAISVLSMLLGNLAALVQSSVRRLLAYSAIAHAGYMLLGVLPHSPEGATALLYYVLTYALATLGAFAVVSVVEAETGGDALADFAGFSRKRPFLSGCFLVFLLSLAGIPPLAGFFGKFYLFSALLKAGSGASLALLWLVILAIAASAVSLYYYLLVLKQVYVVPDAQAPANTSSRRFLPCTIVAGAAALGVIALGCAPGLLLDLLSKALQSGGL
jgi:NADH-quinone oxidoreductase subunit N